MTSRFLATVPALLVSGSPARLSQLTDELLSASLRLEVSSLRDTRVDRDAPPRTFQVVILDAIDEPDERRAAAADELRSTYDAPLVVLARRAARQVIPGVAEVTARVAADGSLVTPHAVTTAIALAAESLRPIAGPAGVLVDREVPRVSIGGEWVVVDELQVMVLRLLLATPRTARSFEQICRATGRRTAATDRRSGNALRRALARACSTLSRAGLAIDCRDEGNITVVSAD